MTSASVAFKQGLGAKKQKNGAHDSKKKNQGVVNKVEEDFFSDSDDHQAAPKRATTLLEEAKHEDTPTLIEIAKSLKYNEQDGLPISSSKAKTAAIDKKEFEYKSTKLQMHKVRRVLEATSFELRTERVVQCNQQVAAGSTAAVADQQYEDDEFEDDAASVREAAKVLAISVAKAKSGRSKPSKDITSRTSMTELETQWAMHEKLSAYQCQQLSTSQRRLFLASIAQRNKAKVQKRVVNRKALNELAKDKLNRARQQHKSCHEFARFDDERHCRFNPRLRKSGCKNTLRNDFDDESRVDNRAAAVPNDFVRRMEAAERARREHLRRTREEAAYLVCVDKKECPSCGNIQSYTELVQKRKKCQNCGIPYRSRLVWSDIAKDFLSRMEKYQQQCKEKHREKQEEYERQEKLACNLENDNGGTVKTWNNVRDDFFRRLQLDLEYRKVSRAAIWDETQRECSFSPSVTCRAQQPLGMQTL